MPDITCICKSCHDLVWVGTCSMFYAMPYLVRIYWFRSILSEEIAASRGASILRLSGAIQHMYHVGERGIYTTIIRCTFNTSCSPCSTLQRIALRRKQTQNSLQLFFLPPFPTRRLCPSCSFFPPSPPADFVLPVFVCRNLHSYQGSSYALAAPGSGYRQHIISRSRQCGVSNQLWRCGCGSCTSITKW